MRDAGKQASPRAEELIAEVYRQILEARNAGKKPGRIVMPGYLWRIIDEYRLSLGVLEGSMPDYLSEGSLFGVEIWYGDHPGIRVEQDGNL